MNMGAVFLFVTWFAVGEPPSNYQIKFNSIETCNAARTALLAERPNLAAQATSPLVGWATAEMINNGSLSGSPVSEPIPGGGTAIRAPQIVPLVSAVCAKQ